MTNESRAACCPSNESRQERKMTEEEAPGAALRAPEGEHPGTDDECHRRTLSRRPPPVEEEATPPTIGMGSGKAKPSPVEEPGFSQVTIASRCSLLHRPPSQATACCCVLLAQLAEEDPRWPPPLGEASQIGDGKPGKRAP